MSSPPPHPAVRALLFGSVALSATVALTGCGVVQQLMGSEDVFSLAVGDCLADDALQAEVSDVQTVPCSEPHMYEVYGSYIIETDSYPGDGEVGNMADEWCSTEFANFVGVEYAHSELYKEHLLPTRQTWEELDDREILCLIYEPGVQTTGTLQGANR